MYSFSAFGHKNILGTHKTTIEFTKDRDLTLRGNCILGVRADFDLKEIKDFIKNNKDKKAKITINVDDLKEEINFELNPDFNNEHEIVLRKSNFISQRTLGIRAEKACSDLNKELINNLKIKDKKMNILITL